MAVRLGIDIGGTFIGFPASDGRTGRSGNVRTPTTPENLSLGPVAGIDKAADRLRLCRGGRIRPEASGGGFGPPGERAAAAPDRLGGCAA